MSRNEELLATATNKRTQPQNEARQTCPKHALAKLFVQRSNLCKPQATMNREKKGACYIMENGRVIRLRHAFSCARFDF